MPVLFSRQVGPKHADCKDAKGLSEWHLFAQKDFRVVGISVLEAVTLRQFVLEGGEASFGLAWAGACHWQVIGIAHGSQKCRKMSTTGSFLGSRIPFLQIFCTARLSKPYKARHKICRMMNEYKNIYFYIKTESWSLLI
jgi:hypothetical protein